MNPNYHSAGEHLRNVGDLKLAFEVLEETGKFRIIRIDPPYVGGYEWWVINEKGFLWESAVNLDEALAYLTSPEAVEYQSA